VSALVFLFLAVVVSVIGTVVLWARSRPSNSPDASIDEFNAKLRALSGDEPPRRPGARSDRRGS
jgi:hypothetical protein